MKNLFLSFCLLPTILFAQIPIVKQAGGKGSFPLVKTNSPATIIVDANDFEVVKKSADLFASDVENVTGQAPKVVSSATGLKEDVVIIGTIDNSKMLDKLVASKKLRIETIKNGWERFLIQTIDNPLPNVKQALVIAGSDRRGTAYGVFSLSEAIGVSPWYWWADVPVKKSNALFVNPIYYISKSPGVKYRGIFINDEDWGINQWARKTFEKEFGSGVGPKTYEKVFELMLRLRLNYIWPAMHEVSKEFGDTPENVELADRYGIVAGSSHCEPMLYNNVHWNARQRGNWNYSTNRDTIYNVWKQTAMARGDKEAIWTTGIRGKDIGKDTDTDTDILAKILAKILILILAKILILTYWQRLAKILAIHDRGMETPPATIPERINVVEKVFKEQRELINQYVTNKWGPVAQCFVPYKEVLPIYDAGLKVPDDVTLIWAL